MNRFHLYAFLCPCLLVFGCAPTEGGDAGAQEVTAVPSCTDTLQNGDESDVDCGGECGPCADGLGCATAGECSSGVCTEGVCVVPTCADGLANGSETALDCGGGCPPCADGLACAGADDCTSGVCTEEACVAPQCDDELTNGLETALDCGGPCSPCADGLACLMGDDCASGICTDQVCAANPRATYPEGPFGNRVDAIIDNISLLDGDEMPLTFADLRQDPNHTTLLVFNTAAWCGRCAADMPDLIGLHESLADEGLVVMVSLFQDQNQDKPNGRDAAQYQRQHDLPFVVVADPMEQMLEFFIEAGLPMVMVVDLDSMELLFAEKGWNLEAMRSLVEDHL